MYEANRIHNDRLPAIPVRGVIFLPNSGVRVEVGRDFSKNSIFESENNRDGYVVLVFQTNPEILEPELSDFQPVGLFGAHRRQDQVAQRQFQDQVRARRTGQDQRSGRQGTVLSGRFHDDPRS
ncbi:MAG: hypothetical protein MZU79_05840 [Anaerotruncus sp.]|nr:hypothetical protein [Anaerotruncus sp.]